MSTSKLPVVLLHGYSDSGASFALWREALEARGYEATNIHLAEYVSLSNEVTIKDIAEGFDRALRATDGLGAEAPFDAIVHSTGGLVIREWLAKYQRSARLKRLICLAPAMFGSPLAHKGRSWIGAAFKGNREVGPDFLEAGDRVLSALELGSSYTWQLAHLDMLAQPPVFGTGNDTPYPFVFIGGRGYDKGVRRFINEDGTDGTVRWAGAALATRKLCMDLTVDPLRSDKERLRWEGTGGIDAPLVILPDHDHGSILRNPQRGDLVDMVVQALEVEDLAAFEEWVARYGTLRNPADAPADGPSTRDHADGASTPGRWQQFVVHVVDERGDPVPDWYLEISSWNGRQWEPVEDTFIRSHTYSDDSSYRALHVHIDKFDHRNMNDILIHIRADSGSELVGYHGVESEVINPDGSPMEDQGFWHAQFNLSEFLAQNPESFFYPWTTTLVEVHLNREPMPPGERVENRVLHFVTT